MKSIILIIIIIIVGVAGCFAQAQHEIRADFMKFRADTAVAHGVATIIVSPQTNTAEWYTGQDPEHFAITAFNKTSNVSAVVDAQSNIHSSMKLYYMGGFLMGGIITRRVHKAGEWITERTEFTAQSTAYNGNN